MSEADVERKFHDMTAARLARGQCDAVLAAIGNLERSKNIGRDLVRLLTAANQVCIVPSPSTGEGQGGGDNGGTPAAMHPHPNPSPIKGEEYL